MATVPGKIPHVIQSVRIITSNQSHIRMTLFDREGANVGTLAVRSADANDLIWLLQPERLTRPPKWMQPNDWIDPPNCEVIERVAYDWKAGLDEPED